MNEEFSKKLANSAEKIANIGDTLLNDENHPDWEVDKIVFTSKTNPHLSMVCEWVMENDRWVKKCRPE